MLSELDLAVLDAVQVNPRASWSLIGSVLDVDPVTVARRWERLHRGGTAWVSVFLGNRSVPLEISYFTVSCERGEGRRVATALARRRNVVTVQHLAGANDLYGIVIAADAAAMADELLVRLPSVDGIASISSYLCTRMYEATGTWRLRVLGQAQVRRLREHTDPATAARTRPFGRQDRELFLALSRNGRRPHTEIAAEIGTSVRTVQRRITALCARRELSFRCDVARTALGWPSAAVLWLNVPDDRLDDAAAALSSLPELRSLTALADERNLLVSVGLRSIGELHDILPAVTAAVPYARIVGRDVALRTDKLCGHLLDRDGRSREVVPIDPWDTGDTGDGDAGDGDAGDTDPGERDAL